MKAIWIVCLLVLCVVISAESAFAFVDVFTVNRGTVGLAPPPNNDVNTWWPRNTLAWQLFWNDQVPPIPDRPWNQNMGNTGNTWFNAQQFGLIPLVLQPGDRIDAWKAVGDVESAPDGHFFFSVDNNSQGLPNTAVDLVRQNRPGHVGGSIFDNVPGQATNMWDIDSQELGLANGDELGDYDLVLNDAMMMMLSLDATSPSLIQNNLSPADIFFWNLRLGGGGFMIGHQGLGLQFNDDVDAIVYLRWPSPQPGFNWAFSLAPGSPTLNGHDGIPGTPDDLSAADIILSDGGGHISLVVGLLDANSLGLRVTDNIDALDAFYNVNAPEFEGSSVSTCPGYGFSSAGVALPPLTLGDVAIPEPPAFYFVLFGVCAMAMSAFVAKSRH